jgi:hypothetical protein
LNRAPLNSVGSYRRYSSYYLHSPANAPVSSPQNAAHS